MKVKLNITLTLPDECRNASAKEFQQMIFDAYINYIRKSHAMDAVKYFSKNSKESNKISDYHSLWADITENTLWSIEALE